MKAAEGTLTLCVRHHGAAGEYARQMRALSERAALAIAYCEWFAFGELAKLKPRDVAIEDTRRALRKAAIDLIACARLATQSKVKKRLEDATSKGISGQIILASRRQFNANIHAARLTARRLAALWPDAGELFEREAARLPQAEAIDWPNRPQIVDAYEAADTDDWKILELISTTDLSLPLDVDVIVGLQEHAQRDRAQPATFSSPHTGRLAGH
jgi:hypothetical protein